MRPMAPLLPPPVWVSPTLQPLNPGEASTANVGTPAHPCRALMEKVPPPRGLTSSQNPQAPKPAWGTC